MGRPEFPGEHDRLEAMGERIGDIGSAVVDKLRDEANRARQLTKGVRATTLELATGHEHDVPVGDIHTSEVGKAGNLLVFVKKHKEAAIIAGGVVTFAGALAAIHYAHTRDRIPSPEEKISTEVIREHAKREAFSETNSNSRFDRLGRSKNYAMDFQRVYHPPRKDYPTAEDISMSFNHLLGAGNFEPLVDKLATNKSVEQAVNIIKEGGKVALIGPHRERIDTLVMLASFQAAAERLEPEILPMLIDGSRIIVGKEMEELALRCHDEKNSAVEAMTRLAGVFTTFPDTEETRANVEAGLSGDIVDIARMNMMMEFLRQAKQPEGIKVAALSPSGIVDMLQDRPDGNGREFVIGRVSPATGKLIRNFDVWLPIAMKLCPEARCEVGELIPISPDRNIERVMSNVITRLCCALDAAEGTTTRYEKYPLAA